MAMKRGNNNNNITVATRTQIPTDEEPAVKMLDRDSLVQVMAENGLRSATGSCRMLLYPVN